MSATPLRLLHRRLAAAMGLAAVAAFVAGAGLESAMPLIAAPILLIALFWAPPARAQRVMDPVWRIIAILLAARAIYRVFTSPEDVVLPMVDLLLLLLATETWRESGAAGDTRVYSLSFALLIASSAYRPGIVFAVAFVAYTGLAVVTLMVGHLIRNFGRHHARDVRLDRSFLFRIASLSGVMLALSAVVFAAFPRVSRGWMTRTAVQTTSMVGFSDRVSIGEHGSHILPNPEVVLRVEFPDGAPPNTRDLYWRGRSYDYFDGVAWSRSQSIPRTFANGPFYGARWPAGRVTQRIYATPLDVQVIFGMHPVLFVHPHSRMRPMQDDVGDLWYYGVGSPSYTVISSPQEPSPEELRVSYTESVRGERFYLQLPSLSDRIRVLADSIVANQPTRYDSVMAVQEYLRTQFTYTLDLPGSAREATLEHFLFRRRAGHCEYFSTAMAVLLRSVGIATRNVNGFLGGNWNQFGEFLTVSQNEAHSWVEVWFPRYGWVPFDGTPAASTDVANAGRDWLGPLRSVFDGFEHRWNKWVLEYNLETQVSLFQRAAQPFTQRNESGKVSWNPALIRWAKMLLLLAAIGMALYLLFTIKRTGIDVGAEGRAYLKMRRAYEKAGYPVRGHDGPLGFIAMLRASGAAGIANSERVVDMYVRARFSREPLTSDEKRELQQCLHLALNEIRRPKAVLR